MMSSKSSTEAQPLRKNRYAAYAKIAETDLERLARLFVRGETAGQAATSLGVNRNTANRYYQLFRESLTRGCCESLRVVPEGPPIVGLFLGAAHIQPRLVPDRHLKAAAEALRGGQKALEACSLEDWPGYDALGDPATGAFMLMPCCLVGPVGQARLASQWRTIRERLCRSRGIARDEYWRHLMVCELIGMFGPERLEERLLAALTGRPCSS